MRIEEYLDTVCAKIKWKEARKPVRTEMEGHIAQRVEEYLANGDSPVQAEEKAIFNMGDAVQTGLALNKLHRPRVDWVLIAALALLLGLGVFYTITCPFVSVVPAWFEATVGGMAAFVLCSLIDLRKIASKKWFSLSLYFLSILIILLTSPSLLHFAFDFSYSVALPTIGSIGLILVGGIWINKIKSAKNVIWFFLAILVGTIVLIAKPEFALVVNLLICTWAMLWAEKMPKKVLIILASIVAMTLFSVIYICSDPYRVQRLTGFFNEPLGAGFLFQGTKGITSNLNWFGAANHPSTNYVETALDGERALLGFMRQYGLVAGFGVVSLCGMVLWRIYKMLLTIKDSMGRTVSIGLCTYITMQIVWNVLINFGIVPEMVSSFIPMFAQVWSQSLIFGCVLGVIAGLFRKSDLYRTEEMPDTTSSLSKV